LLKVEFFEEGFSELSEAVRIVILLSHDNRESNGWQSVSLEFRNLLGLLSVRLRLVLAAAE
jgi:hypothetical protein